MRLCYSLILVSLVVIPTWPTTATACLPPPSHEVALSAPDLPACLDLTADADWEQSSGGLIIADNACSEAVTLTCVSGCGSWTEPITIEPAAQIEQHIDATVKVDWSADGATGQLDVTVTLRDSSGSCGGATGCSGGGATPTAPGLALLFIVGATLLRRAREGERSG